MRTASPRGEPILALAMLIFSWCGARAFVLSNGGESQPTPPAVYVAATLPSAEKTPLPKQLTPLEVPHADNIDVDVRPNDVWDQSQLAVPNRAMLQAEALRASNGARRDIERGWTETSDGSKAVAAAEPVPPAKQPVAPPVRVVAGHQALWLAAVAQIQMPLPGSAPTVEPKTRLLKNEAAGARWSADSWLLLRRGQGGLSASSTSPSYGASQFGAVMRYRLAPGSSNQPLAYLRVSAALDGSRQKEAAFGLSARPIARLPVRSAVEVRYTVQPGANRLRPAAMLITEMAPVKLPLQARAEIYGQAGYVGGQDATAFADGQMRIDRQLAKFDLGELRTGGGVWAGAQKGTSRVDVGPGITLGGPLGGSRSMRLSLDWRFRIAGHAAPQSGPALTLSAGF